MGFGGRVAGAREERTSYREVRDPQRKARYPADVHHADVHGFKITRRVAGKWDDVRGWTKRARSRRPQ